MVKIMPSQKRLNTTSSHIHLLTNRWMSDLPKEIIASKMRILYSVCKK